MVKLVKNSIYCNHCGVTLSYDMEDVRFVLHPKGNIPIRIEEKNSDGEIISIQKGFFNYEPYYEGSIFCPVCGGSIKTHTVSPEEYETINKSNKM